MNWIAAVGAAIATLVAATGADRAAAEVSASAGNAVTAEATATPPSQDRSRGRKGTRITTDDSQFGTMLFNRKRQAIYLFDKERTKKARCYGACAKAWPPVLTKGKPTAGGEVKRRLLGTTKRRNGDRQVTYAGQPLYYYAHEGPGQVFCHNVNQFGGLWLVVHPDGKAAD